MIQSTSQSCDISLWEFATLVDMGRVEIEGSVDDWLRVAASPSTVRIQPITPKIVGEINRLPSAFHRDPADRLIVATARVLKLPLASRDRKIRSSKLVPVWKPKQPPPEQSPALDAAP